ncbi:High-affinity branched-chain amino acid transport ATP-binding protein LivF [Roseovarius aestuarii]|uniref:High-affinity branched-chain amino acid transport ATP-binding protein LivF n=2 Tax=Roseovarius aestuarii TaxID=475083 RepID=A0A1X7BNV1_9RHOB|nr:High-affinity branched-chain amino acid transport ATP-binding protein LivF [Roseovarius aestuarii]
MLEIKNLKVSYDKVEVLHGLSLNVNEGEVVALVGANGAGKSTTLRAVSGLVRADAGTITLDGRRIDGASAVDVTRAGIAHVPEGRRVFAEMSVKENLLVGAFQRSDKDGIARDLASVFERFPRLEERQIQMSGTLSGGEQQMLAIGRALMSDPSVVLMDEPTLGLAPLMCRQIVKIVRELNSQGKTIVLVEQNARMALSVADRAYVIEKGEISVTGTGQELLHNPDIKKAYLGIA